MKVLVTGSAGFIGSNLLLRLPGDVPVTYAGLTYLERDFGFRQSTGGAGRKDCSF